MIRRTASLGVAALIASCLHESSASASPVVGGPAPSHDDHCACAGGHARFPQLPERVPPASWAFGVGTGTTVRVDNYSEYQVYGAGDTLFVAWDGDTLRVGDLAVSPYPRSTRFSSPATIRRTDASEWLALRAHELISAGDDSVTAWNRASQERHSRVNAVVDSLAGLELESPEALAELALAHPLIEAAWAEKEGAPRVCYEAHLPRAVQVRIEGQRYWRRLWVETNPYPASLGGRATMIAREIELAVRARVDPVHVEIVGGHVFDSRVVGDPHHAVRGNPRSRWRALE